MNFPGKDVPNESPLADRPLLRPPHPRPGPKPPAAATPHIGYWSEWSPPDPLTHHGYVADLHLPPGAYLLNASANILIEGDAPDVAEVECSLFVDAVNVTLHQYVLAPGQGQSMSATSHAESTNPIEIQWVGSSTTGPFRFHLAVTAMKVDELRHVS